VIGHRNSGGASGLAGAVHSCWDDMDDQGGD